ncbi:MAG: DNA polymerase III subunit delta [Campylobacterales bacterium]|nr:DNA polymerase III subunit delta [Campylobacterales bacterium]
MYKREFDNLLTSQNIPKAVLLYGDNAFFLDHYKEFYIEKLDAKEDALVLNFEQYKFDQAYSYLSQNSLFGGVNLLIVRSDKKIPKKELDALLGITNKSEINYFIYIFEGSSKDARTLQASFTAKNNALWVRFFEANMREAIEILSQKAQKIGLKIDHYALNHLFVLLNHNIALAVNELDKLAILNREVTSKDIDNLVYSTAPMQIEQLVLALFEKKDIIALLKQLLELGEDEFSILRAIQIFVNQLFMFNAYIKLHGSVDSMAILGYRLPKNIEQQRSQIALRLKSTTLLAIYEHLLESELELKKAKAIDRESLIFGILIKIQSLL